MRKGAARFLLVGMLVTASLIPFVTPSRTSAQDRISLVIWVADAFPFDIKAIAGSFEEDYNAQIEVVMVPWGEMRGRFEELANGPEAPDIFVGSDDWLTSLRVARLVEPIDLGSKSTDFLPFALQAFRRSGQTYGVPFALENLGFVRNTDLVPDPPQTWDDVHQIAQALHDAGEVEIGLALPDYNFYFVFPVITAYGGYMVKMNPTGSFDVTDIGLDNDGAIMALTWLQTMSQDGLLSSGLDDNGALEAFESQHAAMTITGVWSVWSLDESGVPYAVSALPAGTKPAEPFVHVQGLMINANRPDQNKELAKALLIDYVATHDGMQTIYDSIYRVPTTFSVMDEIENPMLMGFAQAAMYGQRFPSTPETNGAWGSWGETIQVLRVGAVSPEVAAKALAEAMR